MTTADCAHIIKEYTLLQQQVSFLLYSFCFISDSILFTIYFFSYSFEISAKIK